MAIKLQGTNSAAAPGLTNDGGDGVVVGTDTVDISIGGASKVHVTNVGRVGLGNTSPNAYCTLDVTNTAASKYGIINTNSAGNPIFGTYATGSQHGQLYLYKATDYGSGTQTILLDTNGASQIKGGSLELGGNLIVPNGSGIDFSATSDATGKTSELLADYEIGTFTPTDEADGLTLSVESANYVKVGNLVHVSMFIDYPVSTSSSHVRIGGLPFTQIGLDTYSFLVGKADGLGDYPVIGQITSNDNKLDLLKGRNSITIATLGNSWVLISGSYRTAA